MRAIRSAMRDRILAGDRKILHCRVCDAEYSGNAGDYWDVPNDYVFTCCGEEMELVDKIVTVEYR